MRMNPKSQATVTRLENSMMNCNESTKARSKYKNYKN